MNTPHKLSPLFNGFLSIAIIGAAIFPGMPLAAQAAELRPIVFPVIGSVSYYDDFGAARVGHSHEGNDLMGKKLMLLVAAVDGTVSWVPYPQPDWGYAINIRDSEGYNYWYLHVNNDNPGTDDGLGDGLHAYAPDVMSGATVVKGQLIGWMGDSGNAEGTGAHLHFEIHAPDGTVFSPYASLKAATKISTPVPAPKQPYEILPYGEFKGGASVAVGRFGGNATIVTGAGPGGGPHVKVMSADGTVLSQFFPYPVSFKGGVDVAAGDIDGDGIDEIITGAGPGGGPHVRILSSTGIPRASFMAYPEAFRGGVRVAAADIDGDGKAEIITGAGPGGGPHVRVFKADGKAFSGFLAYDPSFRGGVDVAVNPAGVNSPARIVTSALSAGGPQVRVFDPLGAVDYSFFAYPETFRGGVKVSVIPAAQASTGYQIVTVPASGGGPDIRLFNSTGTFVRSEKAFEPWWRGGYEVTNDASGTIYITSSGRRASVRTVTNQNPYGNNNGYNNGIPSGNGTNNNNNSWGGGGRRWWGN